MPWKYGKCPKTFTPKLLTKWHMQTIENQIRLLLPEGAVWSGSLQFAIPASILTYIKIKKSLALSV